LPVDRHYDACKTASGRRATLVVVSETLPEGEVYA